MSEPHVVTAPTSACLVEGDCVAALARMPSGFSDLVIGDPPYNFGHPYDAYEDNKSYDEYMAFTRAWLHAACAALSPQGTLWVFCPDEWDDEIRIVLKREESMFFRRKIVWAFTFGQAAQNNFTRAHCNILYFTKHRTQFTFNTEELRVPSARQAIYKDKRANATGKLPDDVWMLYAHQLAPYLTSDRDVWLESRVCGTFKERRPHSPNQLPLPLLERIVRTCSNPGELVADPFLGTGTTGEAALQLGRRFWGCDVSGECVQLTRARLDGLTHATGGVA